MPRGSVRGVNPLTLTFPDPALERAWWEDWAQRSGDRQRVTLAALLGLVAAFAVVDLLAFPQVVAWLWGLRAGSIALAAPALLAFGEPVRAARWGQVAVGVARSRWMSAVGTGASALQARDLARLGWVARDDVWLAARPELRAPSGVAMCAGMEALRVLYLAPV